MMESTYFPSFTWPTSARVTFVTQKKINHNKYKTIHLSRFQNEVRLSHARVPGSPGFGPARTFRGDGSGPGYHGKVGFFCCESNSRTTRSWLQVSMLSLQGSLASSIGYWIS